MDIAAARRHGREVLSSTTPSASLDADLLLAHATGQTRAHILARGPEALGRDECERYCVLLQRRLNGQPVAYLIGRKDWLGMELVVTPAVLVPRPETELVAEMAIAVALEHRARLVVDVGTGSGALAIGLARALPGTMIIGVDVSVEALQIAEVNVRRQVLEGRVGILLGNLLEPVASEPDVVVGNLPYITDTEMESLPREVRAEPEIALRGGAHGLEIFARLFDQAASRRWHPAFVLEIAPWQADPVAELARWVYGRVTASVHKDLAGRDRVVVLQHPK